MGFGRLSFTTETANACIIDSIARGGTTIGVREGGSGGGAIDPPIRADI